MHVSGKDCSGASFLVNGRCVYKALQPLLRIFAPLGKVRLDSLLLHSSHSCEGRFSSSLSLFCLISNKWLQLRAFSSWIETHNVLLGISW